MSESKDKLAQMVARAGTQSDAVKKAVRTHRVVLAAVGSRWFGVAAEAVHEVVTAGDLSRLPAVPEHILGLALVRGRLLPVVALDTLLGEHGRQRDNARRLVVITDGDREIALAADRAIGLLDLAVDEELELDDDQESNRAAWVTEELPWNDALVGLVDVAALISAATDRRGRVTG